MTENEIAAAIVDASYKIHNKLGPGLLESAYQAVLAYELEQRGMKVQTQQSLPLVWDAVKLDVGYRIDVLVDGKVIIELKSVETVALVHKK